jgi:cystathionine gamma-synthase
VARRRHRRGPGHIYGRNTNPTVAVFEEKLRMLEGGEAATSAATGMAAISNMLYALLEPGQRVVSVKDTYGGTSMLFTKYLPRVGVEVELVDTTDADGVEQAMDRGCDLLYLETPTNPTLKIIDLPRLLAALAHAAANLGAVETIVAPPATSSHVEVPKDERAALGIPEGLIRYSAGIENVEDLIEDLDSALDGI